MKQYIRKPFIVTFITVLTVLSSSCSTFSQRKILNPTMIHVVDEDEVESVDGGASMAMTLPTEDYYKAMMLARPSYANSTFKPSDKAYIRNYVTEGLGLVDAYCIRWFHRLEESQRRVGSAKNNFNIISQLGTTLLGTTGANVSAIARYSTVTTALTRVTDNYSDSFLLAPNTKKVKSHIFQIMDQERKDIELDLQKDDIKFKDFYIKIEKYADICTFSTIKEVVNRSLDVTESFVTRDGRQETQAANSQAKVISDLERNQENAEIGVDLAREKKEKLIAASSDQEKVAKATAELTRAIVANAAAVAEIREKRARDAAEAKAVAAAAAAAKAKAAIEAKAAEAEAAAEAKAAEAEAKSLAPFEYRK